MASGASDWQTVFTLVAPSLTHGAPDWQRTAVAPSGAPLASGLYLSPTQVPAAAVVAPGASVALPITDWAGFPIAAGSYPLYCAYIVNLVTQYLHSPGSFNWSLYPTTEADVSSPVPLVFYEYSYNDGLNAETALAVFVFKVTSPAAAFGLTFESNGANPGNISLSNASTINALMGTALA